MLDLRAVWTCWLLWSLTNNSELPSLCPDAASPAWWDWFVCFVLFPAASRELDMRGGIQLTRRKKQLPMTEVLSQERNFSEPLSPCPHNRHRGIDWPWMCLNQCDSGTSPNSKHSNTLNKIINFCYGLDTKCPPQVPVLAPSW